MLAHDIDLAEALAMIRRLEQDKKALQRDLASVRALLDETTRNELRLQYTLAWLQKKAKDET